MRRLVYLLSLAVLGVALVIVPLPLLVVEPGLATSVTGQGRRPALIAVEGDTDPLTGRFLITAVQVSAKSTIGTLQSLIDEVDEVVPARSVIPAGVDPARFEESQRRIFRESVRVAGAVGARAAGREVIIRGGGAGVVGVVPDGPADGVVEQGDVIVAVDGQDVELATELANVIEGRPSGEVVTLELRRGDRTLERRVELGSVAQLQRPGLGVLVRTLDLTIELPVQIRAVDELPVGGPSAGLMFALTVYDLLDPGDLARGRTIAGTGTISLDGAVGPISGLEAKVETARQAGAELFLAPASQADAARAAARGQLAVMGVSSLDDALQALRAPG